MELGDVGGEGARGVGHDRRVVAGGSCPPRLTGAPEREDKLQCRCGPWPTCRVRFAGEGASGRGDQVASSTGGVVDKSTKLLSNFAAPPLITGRGEQTSPPRPERSMWPRSERGTRPN